MSVGLLILRVVVGGLLIGHGTQKLFGWFGGAGFHRTAEGFAAMGFRPGRPFAAAAGLGEAAGGALLLFGLATPIGAAAIVGVMTVAIVSVHLENGPWNTNGGFELPLTNATIAAVLAFTGPGRLSLDHAIGWHPWGVAWGVGAVMTGVLAAAAVLLTRTAPPPAEIERPLHGSPEHATGRTAP